MFGDVDVLVTPTTPRTDSRVMRVRATPAGMSLAREANCAVENADAAFFGADAAGPRTLIEHLTSLDQRD